MENAFGKSFGKSKMVLLKNVFAEMLMLCGFQKISLYMRSAIWFLNPILKCICGK
jgi:hypothetical protein